MKLELNETELGLALIAVEEMIMQLDEADDTEIQSYGFDASTRDGALDTYTTMAINIRLALELETMQ